MNGNKTWTNPSFPNGPPVPLDDSPWEDYFVKKGVALAQNLGIFCTEILIRDLNVRLVRRIKVAVTGDNPTPWELVGKRTTAIYDYTRWKRTYPSVTYQEYGEMEVTCRAICKNGGISTNLTIFKETFYIPYGNGVTETGKTVYREKYASYRIIARASIRLTDIFTVGTGGEQSEEDFTSPSAAPVPTPNDLDSKEWILSQATSERTSAESIGMASLQILDSNSGKPVAATLVLNGDKEIKTDEAGRVWLAPLSLGEPVEPFLPITFDVSRTWPPYEPLSHGNESERKS